MEGKEGRKESKVVTNIRVDISAILTPLSKQLAWAVAASAALNTRRAR